MQRMVKKVREGLLFPILPSHYQDAKVEFCASKLPLFRIVSTERVDREPDRHQQ